MGDVITLLQDSLSKDPTYTIYSVSITLLSLFCLVRGITKSGDPLKKLLHNNEMVRAWEIRWLDILLMVWCMIMATFLQALFLLKLSSEDETWQIIIGTLTMQLSLIGIYFAYQVALPFHNRLPLSTEFYSMWKAAKSGLYYFLASLPIIVGVAYLWQMIAAILDKMGVHINMQEQSFVSEMIASNSTLQLICMTGLAVIIAPIVEETIFRAGIYRFLKSKYSSYIAMLFSGILFALIHSNLASFPTLAALGIALCVAYERTGNIKVPIYMHALFNLNSIIIILLQSSVTS